MKIALVTPYDYPFPGGVTEHILQLDHEFRQRGHDTRIIAASSSTDRALQKNVIKVSSTISAFPFSGSNVRVTISPKIYLRVKKILRQSSFDIVHVHEPVALPLSPIVLHHSQALTIGTFHAYRESNTAYSLMHPVLTSLYSKLDGRIFVSPAVRDMTLAQTQGDYRIIPNGINLQRFAAPSIRPIEQFNDGNPNILFVGRLDKRKGFEYLLHAFPQIQAVLPNARLIVVGAFERAEQQRFEQWTRRAQIHNVHFIGYVSRQEIPRYFRTATLFCAPSTGFESFGIVLLEAMAAGVPIVASDITGYRQVLTHGQEGLLVPRRSPEALAHACLTLLQNSTLRQQMGHAGQHTAARYDWPYIADAVLSYYEELIMARKKITNPVTVPGHNRQNSFLRATE